MLLGSVSSAAVHRADRPIMVIHPPVHGAAAKNDPVAAIVTAAAPSAHP